MKIALFLPNWIGDAVMATPAMRAIRRHFADAEIVGVMRSYLADVLAGSRLLDRCVLLDSPGRIRGRELVAAWRLRREAFDLAVLFPNSFRSGLLAWLAGAKRRVGFARDGRAWLLTDPVPATPRHEPRPVLDEYLRLARALGCTDLSRTMELETTPEDEAALCRFWRQREPSRIPRRIVCLNPGGAYGAAKHWPSESFAELARRIARELNRAVLVLCGPAERATARRIVEQAGHPHVLSLADAPPSIGLTKAAVRVCELLVTTDSGPRHFAPPFNVPVVTLFGPTHIAWSETFYGRAVHLQQPVECGPCQNRVCPEGHHRCMRDLTVERVFEQVVAILAPGPARIRLRSSNDRPAAA
ncbi:MAG TPA: lipopolysaccharide heptosyltransferase II [Planctomycetaceae bacterium]|nr:lipopolysaccharide heptosyltransferase II [Planctomycetaceae bacterium]